MEDDKSLTSMVITVIVALIVTGAVLVPIVGGLAGGGGNGGGGGGFLSNPAPSIPMAYAEEGADTFTITIDAVRYDGEESQYSGIDDTGYLTALTITTPNGSIVIDVDSRLSAYSDYMYENRMATSESFIGNEDYIAVQSNVRIPLVASDETILYYDLVSGYARSFNAPYGDDVNGIVTSITYNEHGGEYGVDVIVDGSDSGFDLPGGFYYVQKDGDFGAYTRGQFKDGIYVSNNYPLNPFYDSDATFKMGVYTIYNEARSVSMTDTSVGVSLNTTIANHRMSAIGWDITVTPHGSGQTAEYSTPPMIIFAPVEVDSNEPGKVYHNTGDMKYSKVTSATNVTIYPYYDEDADEYGFSFQNPAEHPESIVTVSVNPVDERDFFGIFGLDWGAKLSDYGIEEDGDYTYVGEWELWGKVGELVENPDAEIYYLGTISIVNGNATFDGFKVEWDGSQETTTPVQFALPNVMYYPDPEGSYVCPITYDTQEKHPAYTKIYADGATEIFVTASFMSVSGTIENPVITRIAEDIPSNISVQPILEGNILTGFILEDEDGEDSPLSVDTEKGDIPQRDYIMLCVVSATVGEESSGGSGGSSDSGSDLGTVGTIMGVIPIFVVLAILIYAVQYLRTRPEQY